MPSKKFWNNKTVLITGGAGFVGRFVVDKLTKLGVKKNKIIVPRSREVDLRKRINCQKITRGVDLVIHLAGNVGGIGKNQNMPATLFYDNAIMGIELMEAARQNKVDKFVCVSTVCAYPKYTQVPFKEEELWDGYPEDTNAPYGLAKKIQLVQAQAYRQQYGFNCIYLLPVNMYGPSDNFNPESSHVIPALIKKIVDTKEAGLKFVEVWGDGTPTREFLFVEDAARGIILASEKYNKEHPVNIGAGVEISIKDLIATIAKILKFNGEIVWDTTKPNGQPRRLLDTSKAKKEFGFEARTSFSKGLRQTINWYIRYGRKIYG